VGLGVSPYLGSRRLWQASANIEKQTAAVARQTMLLKNARVIFDRKLKPFIGGIPRLAQGESVIGFKIRSVEATIV
jgi:hypothetical protein